MKDIFLSFCRWLLPFFGVSAVISCDNVINEPDMYGCPVPEYGTPVMEFRVKGKVTNYDTGEPVKGIAVSTDDDWEDPLVVTSDNGEFVYESTGFPKEIIKMKFTDVDFDEDGAYMPKEFMVALKKASEGSGAWDEGFYIAEDVVVKMYEDMPAEYGTPIVEFSVKGRVVDADSNPIPNIEVSWGNMYGKTVTAEDGTFEYRNEEIGFEMNDVTLTFTDVDGEENGGDFETEEVQVPLTQTDPGDGNWDCGEYAAEDVVVVLDRKTTDN
jgi:putative lipoprotein (rSAM/lipoprotein system)